MKSGIRIFIFILVGLLGVIFLYYGLRRGTPGFPILYVYPPENRTREPRFPILQVHPSENHHTQEPGFPSRHYHPFETETSNRQGVLIVTYMRSGSSFTGSLFEHSPDVLYFFEPLFFIGRNRVNTKLNFLYGINRTLNDATDASLEPILALKNFLECNLDVIDLATLSQRQMIASRDTEGYYYCLRAKRDNVTHCLPRLKKKCALAKMVVIKTIRFSMKAAELLMKVIPRLKVIYLVRDPRPTIRSTFQTKLLIWSRLADFASRHCDKMMNDISITQRLIKDNPDRVMMIRYEDLAEDPLKHSRMLYQFAGLDYTDGTEKFVNSLTNNKNAKICTYCVEKHNSSAASVRWRHKLSFERATEIDSMCGSVYAELGYIPLTSEQHLLNLSISLHT